MYPRGLRPPAGRVGQAEVLIKRFAPGSLLVIRILSWNNVGTVRRCNEIPHRTSATAQTNASVVWRTKVHRTFFIKRSTNFPSSYVFPILDNVASFRRYSRSKSEVVQNWPKFFWASHFLEGEPPEFLKSIYKIQPDSDHVAKFQGDRSRDLGESVAKKRKHHG